MGATENRPRGPGRPPRITRDDIARAVLEVGFPQLTFAAVRERLGVSESTLFRHAPDRDELVRIALDHAIAQAEWPSLEGPWQAVLERYAVAAWRTWEAYPGSATEATRGIMPIGMMTLMDALCGMLMGAGFPAQNAVLACDVVFDMVTDNRRGIEHIDATVPTRGPGRDRLREQWDGEHVIVPGEGEEIHRAIRDALTADPFEWFSGKLRVVLAGVAQTLAP